MLAFIELLFYTMRTRNAMLEAKDLAGSPDSGFSPDRHPFDLTDALAARRIDPSAAEGINKPFFDECINNGWLEGSSELFSRIMGVYRTMGRVLPGVETLLHIEVAQTIRKNSADNPDYLKENTGKYRELRDGFCPDLAKDKNYVVEVQFVAANLKFQRN